MQNLALIYLVVLVGLLVAVPPLITALLARLGGRNRSPKSSASTSLFTTDEKRAR
jgi:hypothetical protein